MNKDILAGKWKVLKGKIKQQWAELTDDEITHLKGTQDELVGLLQQKYGYKKEEAEKQLRDFIDKN
jgi:uncharacterized protein YjbJ (UPF0337 family)